MQQQSKAKHKTKNEKKKGNHFFLVVPIQNNTKLCLRLVVVACFQQLVIKSLPHRVHKSSRSSNTQKPPWMWPLTAQGLVLKDGEILAVVSERRARYSGCGLACKLIEFLAGAEKKSVCVVVLRDSILCFGLWRLQHKKGPWRTPPWYWYYPQTKEGRQ